MYGQTPLDIGLAINQKANLDLNMFFRHHYLNSSEEK